MAHPIIFHPYPENRRRSTTVSASGSETMAEELDSLARAAPRAARSRRASTCSRTPTAACSTSARRSRSASGSPRISAAGRRGVGRGVPRRASTRSTSSRPRTRPRRCSRSRTSSSSTGRPSTSGCATTSRIRTSGSRSTSDFPRVYFTRERHRPEPRLLRAVLEREARARDARPARQALPVPHLRRAASRAAPPAAPASTTT